MELSWEGAAIVIAVGLGVGAVIGIDFGWKLFAVVAATGAATETLMNSDRFRKQSGTRT